MWPEVRRLLLLFTLVFVAVGCVRAGDGATATPMQASPVAVSPTVDAGTDPTALPTVTQPAPTATVPVSPPPSPTTAATVTLPPSPTAAEPGLPPTDLALFPENVYFYPVPALFEGDIVTFQVIADVPPEIDPRDVTVYVYVNDRIVINDVLRYRNLAGDTIGLYEWAWDSTGSLGPQKVQILLDPEDRIQEGDADQENNEVTLTMDVFPVAQRPRLEAGASWVSETGRYATVHTISNTAAHRDLPFLTATADAAIQQASARLGEEPAGLLDIYFIERVIGQGGYAGGVIVVSYSDRDYAGDGLYEVLVHEAVHIIDRQIAPRRIAFLAEGVAVWATGGHYKQEDLVNRSAALLQTDFYVPLAQLIDNFYPVQHEIGYLEAGGFVQFLVDTYGFDQFKSFYAGFDVFDGETDSAAVDRTLQAYFGSSLAELEAAWRDGLSQLRPSGTEVDDLVLTVRFFNTMRAYQAAYDPTAYFLQAWLPFPDEAIDRGLTADFVRRPELPENLALETMLVAVDQSLRLGDFARARVLLDSMERVLESGRFIDPLALNYFQLVEAAHAAGYHAQRIDLNGRRASLVVRPDDSTRLVELYFTLRGQTWVLSG